MSEIWMREYYDSWIDEVAKKPKTDERDEELLRILTNAFNDPVITIVEYTSLVLRHANKFLNINAIDSSHGELIRYIAEKTLTKEKKKGLF